MKKNRLEAFSDGVFAIVITLLILEVKLPEVKYDDLSATLLHILPSIGAYGLSFILIGMYWMFHHYSFTLIRDVDGILLWLNIIFLLFVSFLPFPTMLMGRYPFQTLPMVIYGINLILANLNGFILLLYLKKNQQLASNIFTDKLYRSQVKMYMSINALYALCVLLALAWPLISLILFACITIFLIIRSAIFMGIGKCVTVPHTSGKHHEVNQHRDINTNE